MKKSLLALSLVLISSAGYAAQERYTIDVDHSTVGFKVKHLFSKVSGRFTKYEGTIELDPANLEKGKVDVSIDSESINTQNENRDKHLRSADFFDTSKFPKLTFKSKKIKKVGDNKLEVSGDLTMRGITKPVTLTVDVLGFGADPFGNYKGGFQAKTSLNRKDFGVSWNKTLDQGNLLLGEDVEIELDIEANRLPAPKK